MVFFIFLPFLNNHSNTCHLLGKLLGDGHVVQSIVCVYNLVPYILLHGMEEIVSADRCALHI